MVKADGGGATTPWRLTSVTDVSRFVRLAATRCGPLEFIYGCDCCRTAKAAAREAYQQPADQREPQYGAC